MSKQQSGSSFIILVIAMVLIIGASVACMAVCQQNKIEYDSEIDALKKDMAEKTEQTVQQYKDTITELTSKVNSLESEISSISSSGVTMTVPGEGGDDSSLMIAVSEKVKKSITLIEIYVPETKYSYGFYTYSSGGLASSGSGIIYSSDGYIITNYHVVSYIDTYDGTSISVTLYDGTEFEAEFVGGDEQNDIAVIKIDPGEYMLTPAIIGESSQLKIGQTVIAVGNPLGEQFAGTVTKGIISGLDRSVSQENTAELLIQTDAAINPGNSGGALCTIAGEVIGITSSKINSTSVEGLGFAIPIEYVMPLVSDLIEYGYVKDRPATGISGDTISSLTAQWYGVPRGILVSAVEEGSGADKAGIKKNDIITKVDGKTVTSMSDIQAVLNDHKVGDSISVTYYRNNTYSDVEVILSEDRGR